MSQPIRQLALSLETHRNHYLFSDYTLNELLPRQPVWREVEAEAGERLEAITALYDRVADALPHYNEAQTEEHWIRPVLDVLGHVYEVQPVLPGALGTPDYAFFTDQETRQAAAPALGKAEYWETVLAVGDAKRWDRPLDKRIVDGAPDAFTNANPCYQIDYYLRRTRCAWGMVSNGRRWRLYHRDSSFRLDVFYEVDLAQLIEQGRLDAFRYFYLFFRAEAFRPGAGEPALDLPRGRCWLDEVLAQSAAYAVRVGDKLKERVYEALRLLAQGFLDYPTNVTTGVPSEKPGLYLDPATDLSQVHDACLILLYRLLFLLYAESRGLLPLDNPSYAGQYSLKAVKEEIARKLDEGVVYLAEKATIWDDLRALFDIIYNGQAALGVPAYDGRLFDPARYPTLEEHAIGDRYLAEAIDLLARAGAGPGQGQAQGLSFVDYRDLSIRHLGSIYEGLLEYRLAYAAEDMAVVRRGKRGQEEIVPASEVDAAEKPGFSEKTRFLVERIPAGQVYLVTDRGERKATGSYYTPDYIVKYIVEQTLGPLADAQAGAVEREIAALKARNEGAARRTRAYKEALARLQNSFADRVLGLNLLDPAMGSGHFLVEATDYLARRIVEAGVTSEVLANGDEESELSYWRRRVVERCIYGVDLNPLAVELARLSLWLATVARGKPLSFLDHHLRCGNSLIGARVADLQALLVRKGTRKARKGRKAREEEAEVQQLAMWDESAFTQDMYRVVGAMRQIQEYETADLVSVKEKERLFEETVERERRKWRAIADLWTATYFGLELTPELYNACVQYVQGKPVLLQAAQAEAVLDQAHEIWEGKRFFHWEIEFPEVFFDEYGRHRGDAAGFDAVVGNPPWVDAWTESPQEQEHRETAFALWDHRVQLSAHWDMYIVFIYQALTLLRAGGRHSFVLPSPFATERYAESLRQHILRDYTVEFFVDFGVRTIFPDVSRKVIIEGVRKKSPSTETKVAVYDPETVVNRNPVISHFSPQRVWLESPRGLFRAHARKNHVLILEKIEQRSELTGNYFYVNYGAQISSKEIGAFSKTRLLNYERTGNAKRCLEGKDISRYSITWRGLWLDYQPEIMYGPRAAALFENEKVLVSKTTGKGFQLLAALDSEQYYCDQRVIIVMDYENLKGTTLQAKFSGYEKADETVTLAYTCALYNSTILSWYFYSRLATGNLQGEYSDVVPSSVRALPIRRIAFTTPAEELERLVGEGLEHEEREIARMTRNAKDAQSAPGPFASFANFRAFRDSAFGRWLDARLSAKPEQADVVHDLLAHLAGWMIEMHREKQAEVRGFLDWLAGYTGLPVDGWALKTSLRSYYEQDWDEMARVLKRNQRKIAKVDLDVDGYRNEPAAKIRAAWECSMETLRPLLVRIAATDRLIDLIVYRLYGLTEEEVAVVEGK